MFLHSFLCNATEIVVNNDILLIKFHSEKIQFFFRLVSIPSPFPFFKLFQQHFDDISTLL